MLLEEISTFSAVKKQNKLSEILGFSFGNMESFSDFYHRSEFICLFKNSDFRLSIISARSRFIPK